MLTLDEFTEFFVRDGWRKTRCNFQDIGQEQIEQYLATPQTEATQEDQHWQLQIKEMSGRTISIAAQMTK